MAELSLVESNIAAQDTAVAITIHQPSGEPYLAPDGEPCTITVLGSESKKFRAMENKITRRNLHNPKPTLDPADLRRNRIDQAGSCVVSWYGWENEALPFECTPENIALLLGHHHILRQVEAGIHGHADFFALASRKP